MEPPPRPRPFWIDTVRVEPTTGLLWRDDDAIRVRPQVMDLLVALAQRPGEVLSKADLLDRIWAARSVSESAVTTVVAELRVALGDDSREPRFVQTVPKRGYRLVAAVRFEDSANASFASPAAVAAAMEAPEALRGHETPESDGAPAHAFVAVAARPHPRRSFRWRWPALWLVTPVSMLLAVGLANSRGSDSPSTIPRIMLPVSLGPGERWPAADISMAALSPEGSALAYIVETDEGRRVMLRELATGRVAAIEGTRGAASPFFSPDGKWLGFFQDGALKRVPTAGGPIESIAAAVVGFGATWRENGDLIYSPTYRSGLMILPAGSTTPRQLTIPKPADGEGSHRWPEAVSGTPFVLYSGVGERTRVRALNLRTGEDHVIVEQLTRAQFAAPDRLVFARGTRLVAAPFDPVTARITGAEREVARDVAFGPSSGLSQFAVSAAGGLAFRTQPSRVERELMLVDRTGHAMSLAAPPEPYIHPRVSPDGRRLAMWLEADTTGAADVWTYELATRTLKQQTHGGASFRPVWGPDSQQLAIDARPSGPANVFLISLSSPMAFEPLARRDRVQSVEDWSSDGRTLVISQNEPDTGSDLLLVDVETRRVRPLANGSGTESGAAVSPDGRWIAFVWAQGEQTGIDIASVDPGRHVRIRVANHGREVRWSRDGRELFFRSGGAMFAVPITVAESDLQAGTPSLLFRGAFEERPATRANYDVMPDGRFLMLRRKEPARQEIVLSFNWRQPLERGRQSQ